MEIGRLVYNKLGRFAGSSQMSVFIRAERRGDGLSLGPRHRNECDWSLTEDGNFLLQATQTKFTSFNLLEKAHRAQMS